MTAYEEAKAEIRVMNAECVRDGQRASVGRDIKEGEYADATFSNISDNYVKRNCYLNCWQKFLYHLEEEIGAFFYSLGRFIGLHPFRFAVATILFSFCLSLGLINLKIEARSEKLWVPQDSDNIKAQSRMLSSFGADT